MLAIALGVYIVMFAVVVGVFYAASKGKPQPIFDWDDDSPSEFDNVVDREPQKQDVIN